MEGNYNFLILSQLNQMKSKRNFFSDNLSEENSALQSPTCTLLGLKKWLKSLHTVE
jgi:hypothetical protein